MFSEQTSERRESGQEHSQAKKLRPDLAERVTGWQ